MKGAFVGRTASAVLVAAVLSVGGCDDNPLDFDERDTERLSLNPTFMVIPAGRSAELNVVALNAGNEPNFAEVSQQANGCGGPASVTVADNPAAVPADPPGRFLVTAGSTLGETCIIVSGGGVTDTVDVIVVGDELIITSDHSEPIRAGEAGTVTALLVASDGTTGVTPFSATDLSWQSSDALILDIAADGSFTTSQSGTAVVTATWSGTEDTGTTGLGVSLSAEVAIEVIADVPVSAAFAESFPALAAGDEATVEVIVSDALGNQNTNLDEILGVTVNSSNSVAVTAEAELVEVTDPATNEVTGVQVFVTVTGNVAGSSEISGTVQTTEGDLLYGPQTATVIAPVIAAIAPASGPPASNVTITGNGFVSAGFVTELRVDGLIVGNFTVVDDNTINAQMPTFDSSPHDVVVDVGGVLSAAATWTQDVDFDEAATEDNDFVLGGTPITASIPLVVSGAFVAEPVDPVVFGAGNDYYAVTLSRDRTIAVVFNWTGGPDNDAFVTDAAFTAFQCGFAGATVSVPESFTCPLVAGDYFVILDNFDLTDATYTLSVTIDE